ncbi:probable serine/threonine-protein kinase PBL3 [Rhododendron vialii]|uniref:probable serine/threonine-protein kinase PBL3 n=1 Tax=Rhododendron vialii TaxID=182163 RepID=UPI00265FD2C5|nr:probable serine/threonine-protein kinase PBL3 [Rhododendron vialii]
MVKIWVDCMRLATTPERQKPRFDNEIKLLTNSDLKGHPNLVKLIGFCCETERLGVVYELKPLDTLEKLIIHDDFTWLARIKVALEFACILECLRDQQLLHRSISAAHLMIDQAFSPRLFDFAMLVGGGFGEIPDIRYHVYGIGSHGYVDPLICLTGLHLNVICILFT